MPIEAATTIATLNPLWPLGTDPKSQGDDHIRLTKNVLQTDFAALVARVTAAEGKIDLPGSIVNSVIGTYPANADLTVQIPADDTIPQIGEGTQIISVTITPKSVTNKLRCRFRGQAVINPAAAHVAALFLNGAANAIAGVITSGTASVPGNTFTIEHEFVPGAMTLQTITVRVGPSAAATMRMNGLINARALGGVAAATLVIEEIKA